jgi:hypothetical protein
MSEKGKSQEPLRQLLEIWPHLSTEQKRRLAVRVSRYVNRLNYPVRLSLYQAVLVLVLVRIVDPGNVMQLAVVFGGALAIVLTGVGMTQIGRGLVRVWKEG